MYRVTYIQYGEYKKIEFPTDVECSEWLDENRPHIFLIRTEKF